MMMVSVLKALIARRTRLCWNSPLPAEQLMVKFPAMLLSFPPLLTRDGAIEGGVAVAVGVAVVLGVVVVVGVAGGEAVGAILSCVRVAVGVGVCVVVAVGGVAVAVRV